MAGVEGIPREPRIEELLADPILQLLLRADRLAEADVRRAITAARSAAGRDLPALAER